MSEENIRIEYVGASALPAATRLYDCFVDSELKVSKPIDGTSPDGGLGIAEVIITVVATGLAKAAAKTALRYIRAFLHERIKSGGALRVRVVVPRESGASKKLPFSLIKATLEAADTFCGEIEKAIDSA